VQPLQMQSQAEQAQRFSGRLIRMRLPSRAEANRLKERAWDACYSHAAGTLHEVVSVWQPLIFPTSERRANHPFLSVLAQPSASCPIVGLVLARPTPSVRDVHAAPLFGRLRGGGTLKSGRLWARRAATENELD
jgi:hypothetical protein